MTNAPRLDDRAHRGRIAPIAGDVARPLWSVMIPTYNCARFLRATLESVLRQDPGPDVMQIQVVDDCSSKDDPKSVVDSVGAGRVSFMRQERNVGHVRNFNTCLELSRGRLVHLLHGDDTVAADFYRRMQTPFETDARIGVAACRYATMDEHSAPIGLGPLVRPASGIVDGWLDEIAVTQRLQTVGVVVRREVYETLGGYDERIRYCAEDWELWVRIGASYPLWYEPASLASYRVHRTSLTGTRVNGAAYVRDVNNIIDLNARMLPPGRQHALTQQARQTNARAWMRRMKRDLQNGTKSFPWEQVRETYRMYPGPEMMARTVALMGWWAAYRAVGRAPRS